MPGNALSTWTGYDPTKENIKQWKNNKLYDQCPLCSLHDTETVTTYQNP